MHLSRLAGEEVGAVVGRNEIPARVYCEGDDMYSVCSCACVCVLKKSESKKETDRNTQTSARILWSFSRSTALFRGAFLPSCGHMWDDTCGQESLQRVTLASV